MAEVNGACNSRFTAVKDLLQAKIDADEEPGASLVININGENVVDICGGYADLSKSKPWEENTLTNVWSSSKTVYWPEFAQIGKQDIEVRHFLSHSSGLSGWQDSITIQEVCDLEASAARLTTQAPWWTPGTASGYHSSTIGHLHNELTQRVTSKSLAEFVATELAGPLQADLTFGVPASDIIAKTLMNPLMNPLMTADFANQDFWRQACVPAANGFTNARGIAKLLSIVSCGGTVDGKKWLKPETVDRIFEEQTNGSDFVISARTRFGIGFGLNGVGDGGAGYWIPKGKICFWGGWGGSVVICDVGRGITVTYKMSNAGLGSGLAKW
ncbi:hypothetical protein E8E11_005636 [Didymella keratinophila]|nr:hypothetical protein E8E11_005636 [Didymella keratinophila]